MRRLVFIASAFAAGAAIVAAQRAVAKSKSSELVTVRSVDLKRYMGKWYEIARYPNWFQRDCQSDTLATYTLRNDGKVEVVNSCRKANGEVKEARGKAKVVDGSNARLKVTFFWPFYGDYWIIGLDPDYRWVVVGEPARKYLWILSRTPQMSDADYQQALQIIRASDYDPAKLVKTPQSTRR
ncbi:MAG TPA: lipocalin family protein [Candidatus Angelobacter sp.]|nr:lipocalin family protein [Candidatus Angelobacter sp.]